MLLSSCGMLIGDVHISTPATRRSWSPTLAAEHDAAVVMRNRPGVAVYFRYPRDVITRQ